MHKRRSLYLFAAVVIAITSAACTRQQLAGSAEGFGVVVAESTEWTQRLEQETHGIGTPAPDLGVTITPTGEAVNSPLFDDDGRYLGVGQAAPQTTP